VFWASSSSRFSFLSSQYRLLLWFQARELMPSCGVAVSRFPSQHSSGCCAGGRETSGKSISVPDGESQTEDTPPQLTITKHLNKPAHTPLLSSRKEQTLSDSVVVYSPSCRSFLLWNIRNTETQQSMWYHTLYFMSSEVIWWICMRNYSLFYDESFQWISRVSSVVSSINQ